MPITLTHHPHTGRLATVMAARQDGGMLRRLRLLVAAAVLAGCGDGTFIIAFNSGVIVGAPRCDAAGGQFDLRQPGGLEILVVITSSTTVVVAGTTGACADLFAGAAVEVSGRQSGDRLVAGTVTLP